jgi:hypothetical protein
VSFEGVVDATNALVKEAQVTLQNIVRLDAFVSKKTMEHNLDEGGIPS